MESARVKVRMAELTGGEARELYPRNPVILLPMGSLEDQGPHAPMGDYMLAERIAEAIAERATAEGTRTLVAPTLPYGGNDYFASVPGGIAMSQPTFRAIVADIFACLLRHGLTRLIVVSGHGGNVDAVHQATIELRRNRGIVIPNLYLWRMANPLLAEILGADTAAKSTGHGADPLTSLALHYFPKIVRPDMIPEPVPRPQALGLEISGIPTVRFGGTDIHLPLEIYDVAPGAVWVGDPRLCSAETGAALAARLTEVGAGFVHHFVRSGPDASPPAA